MIRNTAAALLLTALLAGCGALHVKPEPQASAEKGHMGPLSQMVEDDNARAIRTARNTLSLRATTLREGEVTTALRQACRQGKEVRVILYNRKALELLEGSCAELWHSTHPDMAHQAPVLLADESMWFNGNLIDVGGKKVRKEWEAQNYMIKTGRRVR